MEYARAPMAMNCYQTTQPATVRIRDSPVNLYGSCFNPGGGYDIVEALPERGAFFIVVVCLG